MHEIDIWYARVKIEKKNTFAANSLAASAAINDTCCRITSLIIEKTQFIFYKSLYTTRIIPVSVSTYYRYFDNTVK